MTFPELAIGAALVLGAVQVADGELSAGTLVAFLSTALALRWPVESIGFLLAMSQEAATAADRFFEVMDDAEERGAGRGPPRGRAPACTTGRRQPPGRAAPPRREAGAAGSGSRACGSGIRTPRRDPALLPASTCTSGPARPWRWSARPAAARPR